MPGKMCTGAVTNQSYLLKETKAFSEGLYYRAGGTAVTRPPTDNPHDGTGSYAEDAWDQGWAIAQIAAGGTISQADAPCVAVPTNTISA